MENEAIKLYVGDTVLLDVGYDLVKVKISQLYGIEINDFAVSVANAALWIAESQMLEETLSIAYSNIDFLPIKSYSNIVEGNALRLNWEEIIPKNKLSYIIGNPPFLGARLMSSSQKEDMIHVFGKLKGVGNLDYVSAWYRKSAELIQDTSVEVALVSTNSITQGEQVAILWKNLMIDFGIVINFAYLPFVWNSEAKDKAKVHCVIIGFSKNDSYEKKYSTQQVRLIK